MFLGFTKYYSVTNILLLTGLPSFDTRHFCSAKAQFWMISKAILIPKVYARLQKIASNFSKFFGGGRQEDLQLSIISPLKCLYFNVGNFDCRSLSLYVKCLIVKTNLVALLWTVSRSFIRSGLCGFHTELAYSKWDLTKLLYSVTNASSVEYIIF